MQSARLCLICSLILASAHCAWADTTANNVEPPPSQPRLISGTDEIAPETVIAPWRAIRRADGRHFYVERERVVEVAADHVTIVSEVASPDGLDLAWLGHVGDVVYMAQRRLEPKDPQNGANEDSRVWDVYPDPVVLRLDLEKMNWLAPLRIEPVEILPDPEANVVIENSEKPAARTFLGHILPGNAGLTVLTFDVTNNVPAWWGERMVAYQVTQFAPRGETQAWARKFPALSLSPERSSALYQDGVWQSAITALTRSPVRDQLIVCAGENDDLICLSVASGDEYWRIHRLWEYDAGYYPSEYEPYVTRLGASRWVERTVEEKSERQLKELTEEDWRHVQRYLNLRSRFRREVEAEIVAGPVIIPRKGVYVGARRRSRSIDGVGEHPWESIVYKIDEESGELEACTRLPAELSDVVAPMSAGEATAWAFANGGMARILPDSNLILPIDWYRSRPTGKRPVEEYVGIPTASDEEWLVRFGSDQSVELIDAMSGFGESARLVGIEGAKVSSRDIELDAGKLTLVVASTRGTVGFRFDIRPAIDRLRSRRPLPDGKD